MKKCCIMIFTDFTNGERIDAIRNKYDPLAHHVRPHITLVFPFESDLQSEELKDHLVGALLGVRPFEIILSGIASSRAGGNYLFLNVERGREEIIGIHQRLYSGQLEKFLPVWLRAGDYHPHLTVGRIEREEEYKAAMEETSRVIDVFRTTVEKISVEIIDENEDSILEMEIPLQTGHLQGGGCSNATSIS